jgi:hypothetical protein
LQNGELIKNVIEPLERDFFDKPWALRVLVGLVNGFKRFENSRNEFRHTSLLLTAGCTEKSFQNVSKIDP